MTVWTDADARRCGDLLIAAPDLPVAAKLLALAALYHPLMSRKDLADLVGLSVNAVGRAMKQAIETGWILQIDREWRPGPRLEGRAGQ